MDRSTQNISPLRQRMIEDMRMRKFGEKTQLDYLRAVRNFTKYLGRSPDTASVEDLRNYQLHLVDNGISPASLNSAISGLKFFFNVSLDRPELVAKMQPVHLPRKLPVILSPEEVKRLIAAAGNLKHQTALALAYATGLRVNEVAALKVGDIDSQYGKPMPVGQNVRRKRGFDARCSTYLAHGNCACIAAMTMECAGDLTVSGCVSRSTCIHFLKASISSDCGALLGSQTSVFSLGTKRPSSVIIEPSTSAAH
jgi:hypothetical protein